MGKLAAFVVAGLLLSGYFVLAGFWASTFTVGTDIGDAAITEFYYTYSRTYENAWYQRYHFYVDGGTYRFYHETREAEGPAFLTEQDMTRTGTVALTKDEWQSFLAHIRGGTVRKKQEDASAGGAGPWEFLYWKGDKGVYREYHFPSPEEEAGFVAFCEGLRDAEASPA